MNNFSISPTNRAPHEIPEKSEKQKRNDFREKMRKGHFGNSFKLPFKGKSTSKETYSNLTSKVARAKRCAPIDELMIPYDLKLDTGKFKTKE